MSRINNNLPFAFGSSLSKMLNHNHYKSNSVKGIPLKKGFLFSLSSSVESLVLILCFFNQKMYITKAMLDSVVQASDINNTCKPQEFLEFVNKSGQGSDVNI